MKERLNYIKSITVMVIIIAVGFFIIASQTAAKASQPIVIPGYNHTMGLKSNGSMVADEGIVEDILPPLIQRIESSVGPTTLQVTRVTDEPSSGIVNNGETLDLGFSEEHTDLKTSHTILIADLQPETFSVTTLPVGGLGPTTIDMWYGVDQTFGARGRPQRWLNVLGNTSDPDGVVSLTYSLNAGPEVPLNLGPDDFRLDEDGDFNIEIDINDPNLNVLPLQNSVLIRALDIYDNETTLEVMVNYSDSSVWPENDTIDWSSFSSINDVAQVAQIVDGLWTLEGDKIRSIQPGYDRLVSIGDIDPTWGNYEVTVPITVHSIEEIYGPPGGGPTLGVIVRWQGHTADGNQPSIQWWPTGAMGAYKWRSTYQRLEILDLDYTAVDDSGFELQLGIEYMFKFRVESDANNSIYSLKVWPTSDPEPIDWTLVTTEALSSDQTTGSVLLVAQFVDASFGEVTIVPLSYPSSEGLGYAPMTPCRIIDTRISQGGYGKITGGTQRNFIVTDLCGVPFGPAKALMINIAATEATGPGNLRAFAYPDPVPFAAVLNYGVIPGLNAISNAAIIPICDNNIQTCDFDLSIWVSRTTDVVIDVMGYFAPSP
jgi:hypothetical protein